MQGYAHLAQEERYHIESLQTEGRSIRRIAERMRRCSTTRLWVECRRIFHADHCAWHA